MLSFLLHRKNKLFVIIVQRWNGLMGLIFQRRHILYINIGTCPNATLIPKCTSLFVPWNTSRHKKPHVMMKDEGQKTPADGVIRAAETSVY